MTQKGGTDMTTAELLERNSALADHLYAAYRIIGRFMPRLDEGLTVQDVVKAEVLSHQREIEALTKGPQQEGK